MVAIGLIVKLAVLQRWKVLPCRAPECDISTNKRYRGPAGKTYVACCYKHAAMASER